MTLNNWNREAAKAQAPGFYKADVFTKAGDRLIAEVFGTSAKEANGRAALIAAAPELLKALTNAETWLLRISDEVLDGEGSRPQYNAVREQVRAAIRKATP